jgi:hypothetical protein
MPEGCFGELDTKTGLVFELELDTETGLRFKNQNILNKYLTGNSTLKIPVGAIAGTEDLTFDCWYI